MMFVLENNREYLFAVKMQTIKGPSTFYPNKQLLMLAASYYTSVNKPTTKNIGHLCLPKVLSGRCVYLS